MSFEAPLAKQETSHVAAQKLIEQMLPKLSEDQQKLLQLLQAGDGERQAYSEDFLNLVVHHEEDGTGYTFADYFQEDQPGFIDQLRVALTSEAANETHLEKKQEKTTESTETQAHDRMRFLIKQINEQGAANQQHLKAVEAQWAA